MKKVVFIFISICLFLILPIILLTSIDDAYASNASIRDSVNIYVPDPKDFGGNPNNIWNPGVTYSRIIELQQSSFSKKVLLATCEIWGYETGKNKLSIPIFRSSNNGQSWEKITSVTTDLVNGLSSQPFLYELDRPVGDMPKGTILLVAVAASYNGDNAQESHILLYKSTNLGNSFEFVSQIAESDYENGHYEGVWEPFLMVNSNNELMCFYSDERDSKNHKQKIVYQSSKDGISWGKVSDVVVASEQSITIGNVSIAKMKNSKYIMTYSIINNGANYIYYRFSTDGISWGDIANLGTKLKATTGNTPGSAPYVVYTDKGSSSGTLIVTAGFDVPKNTNYGSSIFVSTDYGGTWKEKTQPLPHNYGKTNYHTNLGYSSGMYVSSNGYDIHYVNNVDYTDKWAKLSYTQIHLNDSGISYYGIDNEYVDMIDLYKPDPENFNGSSDNIWNPGVTYSRVIELQQTSSSKKILLATSEIWGYETGKSKLSAPIFKSEDGGKTWKRITSVTTNYVNGLSSQPFLYELDRQIGDMPKGTILLAAVAASYNGANQNESHILLYKSTDMGNNFTFLTEIASADGNTTTTETGVWEPFLLTTSDGRLVCYYSDGRDNANYSQKLVRQISSDGINWGEPVNAVTMSPRKMRPGMPVIADMGENGYVMAYEVATTDKQFKGIDLQFSNDGLNWGNTKHVKTTDGIEPGSGPYIVYTPRGGENGLLFLTATFQVPKNSNDGSSIFVSSDYGNTWTTIYQPLPYGKAFYHDNLGYSSGMFVSDNGYTIHYVNNIDYTNKWAKFSYTQIHLNDDGIDYYGVPNKQLYAHTINTLANIKINGSNIEKFNSNTLSYNLKLPSNTKNANIVSTLSDDMESYVSGYGNRSVDLKYGPNVAYLKVKSETNEQKTYTLNILRELVKGDANADGVVSVADVSKIYSYIRGSTNIEEDYCLEAINVNGDSTITIADVSKIYSYVRKAINEL